MEKVLVEHLPATDSKPDRIILFKDSVLLGEFASKGDLRSSLSGLMADIKGRQI